MFSRWSPAPAPWSATRSPPTRESHGVGFIGSVATGLQVAARAAGKTTLLELGGNGPLVVLEDADVAGAAEASIAASFLCAGQSCTAGELFLVHDAVHDEFVARLADCGRELGATRRPARRRRRRWARSTTSRPREDGSTRRDALERGAELVAGGSRASGIPDRPLLGADGAFGRDRRDGGRARRDIRPRRPDHSASRATKRRCRSQTRHRTAF